MFKFYIVIAIIVTSIIIYLYRKRIESMIYPYIYQNADTKECIKVSSLFNRDAKVRNSSDSEISATVLNYIDALYRSMIRHLAHKYKGNKEVEFLISNFRKRYNRELIFEGSPETSATSYLVNKKMYVICLRDEHGKIHDLDTITMVALHELAHMLINDAHHTPYFMKIHKFLLKEALEIGVYNNPDYNSKPVKYCGQIILDENINLQ